MSSVLDSFWGGDAWAQSFIRLYHLYGIIERQIVLHRWFRCNWWLLICIVIGLSSRFRINVDTIGFVPHDNIHQKSQKHYSSRCTCEVKTKKIPSCQKWIIMNNSLLANMCRVALQPACFCVCARIQSTSFVYATVTQIVMNIYLRRNGGKRLDRIMNKHLVYHK